jgi:hypothetical protein
MQNQQHLVAQMPLQFVIHRLRDTDWRKKTGDRKNLPWCYHNGGPLGFFRLGFMYCDATSKS